MQKESSYTGAGCKMESISRRNNYFFLTSVMAITDFKIKYDPIKSRTMPKKKFINCILFDDINCFVQYRKRDNSTRYDARPIPAAARKNKAIFILKCSISPTSINSLCPISHQNISMGLTADKVKPVIKPHV